MLRNGDTLVNNVSVDYLLVVILQKLPYRIRIENENPRLLKNLTRIITLHGFLKAPV